MFPFAVSIPARALRGILLVADITGCTAFLKESELEHAHREVYDAGEVEGWVADMTPVWEAACNRSVIEIPESEYRGKASVEIALPVEHVWDRLSDPDYRRILLGSDRQVREGKGRLGQGGRLPVLSRRPVVPSVILEWLPFTRMLTKDLILIHVPGSTIHLLVDYTLAPTESGTVLTMACARPEGTTLARASFTAVVPAMLKAVEGGPRRLQGACRDGSDLAAGSRS